jgi:hypothetical protein
MKYGDLSHQIWGFDGQFWGADYYDWPVDAGGFKNTTCVHPKL